MALAPYDGATRKMTVGSLFAGIGGFDLGLERAGFEIKWQVEIDPFCRKVLEKHWPDVPRLSDVREVGAQNLEPVDLICGGFPCQDISLAGNGAGIEGDRSGLWGEMARVVGELRPRYLLVENVSALLGRGLGRVLGDLAALGYDAEWECLPASAFGALHHRDRIWIVACADSHGLRSQGQWPPAKGPWSWEQFTGLVQAIARVSIPAGGSGGISDGVSARVHRLKALGNGITPQIPEWIGRRILEAEAERLSACVPA